MGRSLTDHSLDGALLKGEKNIIIILNEDPIKRRARIKNNTYAHIWKLKLMRGVKGGDVC